MLEQGGPTLCLENQRRAPEETPGAEIWGREKVGQENIPAM